MRAARASRWTLLALLICGVGLAPVAAADAGQYLVNDYGTAAGVRNVLPAGEAGTVTLADYIHNRVDPTFYPPHVTDQLPLYDGPTFTAPGALTAQQLQQFTKEETFGVAADNIDSASTETPVAGLTIMRDKAFGVPHIFATTRLLAEYGAGWASAEDRLFMMDVLRHAGRGNLATLVGSSGYGNDCGVHYGAGYDSADEAVMKATLNNLDPTIVANGEAFAAGVNGWIASPGFVQHPPVEYTAFPPPVGSTAAPTAFPLPVGNNAWKVEDIIAVGTLIGSQLGGGGGAEAANTLALKNLIAIHGPVRGRQVFDDLHAADNPESPTTIDLPFPYESRAQRDPASVAMIASPATDPNGCKASKAVTIPPLSGAAALAGIPSLALPGGSRDSALRARIQAEGTRRALDIVNAVNFKKKASNAQVVSASRSASGHPIADFGSQAAYFMPEIFMEMDVHAPDWDARGFQFPGTGVFVELGRGRDYAWSATSAMSDVIDQRAELLCNPTPADGKTPLDNVDPNSTSFWYKGTCRPMVEKDVQYVVPFSPGTTDTKTEIWAGTETFHVERMVHDDGIAILQGRTTALRNGVYVPVAISNQRSTFFHELDQAVGFAKFNSVSQVHDAKSFMAAAAAIDTTFNWFYVDAHDAAYFTSGKLPVRAPGADPDLLNWGTGEWDWQGWLPASQHAQAINPPRGWMTSWNNRPAPHWGSADSNWDYGSIYRNQLLDRELQKRLAGSGGRVTPVDLFNVMQVASITDFRAQRLLDNMLAIIGSSGLSGPEQSAITAMSSWHAAGDTRQDLGKTGSYAHADGIAVFDALYPHLIHGVMNPWVGSTADPAWCPGSKTTPNGVAGIPKTFDNPPSDGLCYGGFSGFNVGSAFDGGWQDVLEADFRHVLGQPRTAVHPDVYCGGQAAASPAGTPTDGTAATCRRVLLAALDKGIVEKEDAATVTANDKMNYRSLGLFALPNEQWANKPTEQQFVEFLSDRQTTPDATLPAVINQLPNTAAGGAPWALALLLLASLPVALRRGRPRRRSSGHRISR